MAKQAKLQLVADVKTFKQSIQEARNLIQGLGDVDVSDKAIKKLSDTMENDLANSAKKVEQEIHGVRAAMVKLGQADIVDTKKVNDYVKKLGVLKKSLGEIKQAQKELQDTTPDGSGVPDAPQSGGLARGGQRMISKGLGAFGLGVGVAGALMMSRNVSREQSRIRALTGGTMAQEGIGLEYGFSEAESRQRQEAFSRAAGRDLSSEELTKATRTMMQAERAYGVETGTSQQLMTAGRKAGVKDQGKFLGDTIGMAVAANLEGSRITEFLQASTAYLEQMSSGINIDSQSLNGFAGALSTIPFFSQDPNRAFNMMKNLNQMFQSGDPYQRVLASRGIISSVGGKPESLGALEMRRKMGLFGKLDDDTKKRLGETEEGENLLKTLGVGGPKIIQNMFKDIMSQTSGADMGNRMFAFQQATGMEAGSAAAIFTRLEEIERKGGGKLTDKDMEFVKQAQMSPEDRLAETFKGTAKDIQTFTSKLQDVIEQISKDVAVPISKLGNQIPLNTKELARVAEGLMVANVLLGSSLGGKILDKIPGMGGKGGAGGLATKMLGGLGRTIGGLGRMATPALAGTAAALYSENLGPKEGSLDWKIENRMPLTDEERKSLAFDFSADRTSKSREGFDLLQRPKNMDLPPSSAFEAMPERANYVEAQATDKSGNMIENTSAIKNLTDALNNAANKSGGFVDKMRTPMGGGTKVGV
jgi:hypothetical protein